MQIPHFKTNKILQLLHGIAEKWGGSEKCKELAESIRSVTDHQEYLRRVAKTPEGARNFVAAAVLGVTIAGHLHELVGENPERN